MFDKEECGKILSAELRHILLALGERLSTEEVDELLKGVEDSEGLVNYERKITVFFASNFFCRIHQKSHGRPIPGRLNVVDNGLIRILHLTQILLIKHLKFYIFNSNVIKSFLLCSNNVNVRLSSSSPIFLMSVALV